jgi:hypothetical protein
MLLMLCCSYAFANAQQFMFVNKDTVGLYKYPDYKSEIDLLLHAPTKIAVEELKDTTDLGREAAKEWVAVKFFLSDGTWSGGTTYYGYVPRKYLVNDLTQVSVENVDTTVQLSATHPATDSLMMSKAKVNFKETTSGECYYISSYAKRAYVKQNYCSSVEQQKMRRREEDK